MQNPKLALANMVVNQIIPSVTLSAPLRAALLATQRHIFVPQHLWGIAYMDNHLALTQNRYLMSPMMFARLVQLLAVTHNDVVLDIGCTTGYSTAIFAQIARKVIALEPNAEFSSKANHTLNSLGITNSIIISNNLVDGHPETAPYDVIFINGAVQSIPASLFEQLGENGRLIAVLYQQENYNAIADSVFGEVVLFQKNKDFISKKSLFSTTLFPLAGF